MSAATKPVDDLPLYDVQLLDTYLLEARVARRPASDGETGLPGLEAGIRHVEVSEDNLTLDAILGVLLQVPYREGQSVLEVECSVFGHFRSGQPRLATYWEAFSAREAIALLWPYARAMAGEIGRMTGLVVPMLPTLDVMAMLDDGPPAEPPKAKRRRRKAATSATATG